MRKHVALFQFLLMVLACNTSTQVESARAKEPTEDIVCSDSLCFGTYDGPEFVNGSDVAHQFSNKMAAQVGNKLKGLYKSGKYSKVDFRGIEMKTAGMDHKGDVEYTLRIPLIRVADSCDAKTAFDHRGGWGHEPSLNNVLIEFKSVLGLEYQFTSTPEGLTEYWLQWNHNSLQANCIDK